MEMPLKKNFSLPESRKKISFFNRTLIEWFQVNERKFPWRNEKDVYHILIAEVMLQRTRAEQVVPVYTEFIARFPDVGSVISAKPVAINSFIKRLGLIWRTELIMKMFQNISDEYGGLIPVERKKLLAIPGIGDYIADALTVFGYGGRRTVIDSNVVRLVSRFFGIPLKGEMRRNKDFTVFCQLLIENIPSSQIKKFNWALIDHAALVCKPQPRCQNCPLSISCSYFKKQI